MTEDIKKEVEALTDKIIAWRRDFHRHPEVAFKEERTSKVLCKFLEGLGLAVESFAKTGLRAILEGRPGGPTVALRADIDALPLEEEGDKAYISRNPGAAHACGHDGHMAILMAAAQVLARRKNQFNGRIAFLFQPAEELPPGGAKPMIEEGVLDGVDAIFGLHLWQSLPTGSIGIVEGPMMAAADNFTIRVTGRGGHGSMPHQAVDSILAASQVVVNTQSIVSRSVDPLAPAVVSFGTVKGGTVYNIIPGEVLLTGTVRTFEPGVQTLIQNRLQEIAESTCRSLGAKAEFRYEQGYPPLVNDKAMTDLVRQTAQELLGPDSLKPFAPIMGGEDFAYYLQKIPGAFFFFGMGDGMEFPHHHPAFDLDERALPQAVLLMTLLVLRYPSGKEE